MHPIYISASILSADFSQLGQEITQLNESKADMIHFDVMDGCFVPNITFGAQMINSLRSKSNLIFDTHLMVSNPQNYIQDFADAGSDYITIHAESTIHLHRVVKQIKSFGKKAGIAIVPSTNEDILKHLIGDIDLILVMTVNPGFAGQKFIASQLNKIITIKRMIDEINPKVLLSVDGGINVQTSKQCIKAGANILVSAGYIFSTSDYHQNIINLKNSIY